MNYIHIHILIAAMQAKNPPGNLVYNARQRATIYKPVCIYNLYIHNYEFPFTNRKLQFRSLQIKPPLSSLLTVPSFPAIFFHTHTYTHLNTWKVNICCSVSAIYLCKNINICTINVVCVEFLLQIYLNYAALFLKFDPGGFKFIFDFRWR